MTQNISSKALTIATFNILHDNNPLYKPVLKTQVRFKSIIDDIINISQADIFCLNQVNQRFWNQLTGVKNKKFKFMSTPKIQKRGHAVVVLSKKPFQILILEESVVISLHTGYKFPFLVIATHLSAKQDFDAVRQFEIQKIENILKELKNHQNIQISQAIQKNNIIILGDLNLHLISQTKTLYKFGYVDAWLEIRQNQLGYTWDPEKNKLINYFLPFDNRRMRLDRISIKNNGNLRIQDIQIIANKKIKNTLYLFPSDHFGLQAKISLSDGIQRYDHREKVNTIRNQTTTGFRKIQRIIQYRIFTMCLIGIILIYPFVFFL